MNNPLLLDVPTRLETQRLMLRMPCFGDGGIVYESVRESLAELKRWLPWATDDYSEQSAEEWCRRSNAAFLARKHFQFLIFLCEGTLHLGNVGLFAFAWEVPKCEIGYWLRTSQTGHGYMTEAANGLWQLGVERFNVERLELRCDELNERSSRLAARCGFALEGVLRSECRGPNGRLRQTCIFARTRDR